MTVLSCHVTTYVRVSYGILLGMALRQIPVVDGVSRITHKGIQTLGDVKAIVLLAIVLLAIVLP